jgi:hypothetical protein
MVGAGELHSVVVGTKSSRSGVVPVEADAKISDRVPTQDTALLQAAPVLPSAQVSATLGSSPELQLQLETVVSDVAVVRRIVERIAAVQEQMALDFATLQKSDQNVRRIARSDIVAHSPSVPVPTAPARTPWRRTDPPALRLRLHPRAPPYGQLLRNAAQSGCGGSTSVFSAAGSRPHRAPSKTHCRSRQARQGPFLPHNSRRRASPVRSMPNFAVANRAGQRRHRTKGVTSTSWIVLGPAASDGVSKLCLPRLARREDHFYFPRFRRRALGSDLALTAPQPTTEGDAHALLEA